MNSSSGVLTLAGVGELRSSRPRPRAADDYDEATATFNVAVQAVAALVLNLDAVATDNTVNVAEKTAGFTISGDTGTESRRRRVTVAIGADGHSPRRRRRPIRNRHLVGERAGGCLVHHRHERRCDRVGDQDRVHRARRDVQRALTVDLTAPTAPTYTAPASLKVGVAIAAMSPTGGIGVDEYKATGLPTGLSIDTPAPG